MERGVANAAVAARQADERYVDADRQAETPC